MLDSFYLEGKITRKHADQILEMITSELAAAVEKAKQEERAKVLTQLIDDWRVWEDDRTVTVKEVLDHLKYLLTNKPTE